MAGSSRSTRAQEALLLLKEWNRIIGTSSARAKKPLPISAKTLRRWFTPNYTGPCQHGKLEGIILHVRDLIWHKTVSADDRDALNRAVSDHAPREEFEKWVAALSRGNQPDSLVQYFHSLFRNTVGGTTKSTKQESTQHDELLTALAATIGLSPDEAAEDYHTALQEWTVERVHQHQSSVQEFASRSNRRELLSRYYASASHLSPLTAVTLQFSKSERLNLAFFVEPALFNTKCPIAATLTDLTETSRDSAAAFARCPDPAFALEIFARLRARHVELTDDAIFRLEKISSNTFKALTFSISRYFEHRFKAGLMQDELEDALVAARGDFQSILRDRPQALPVRALLMPDVASMSAVRDRVCVGGISVVFAVARGPGHKDFAIPIAERSSAVGENAFSLAVLPSGLHAPTVRSVDPTQCDLRSTILRECYEELLGGKSVVEQSETRWNPEWFHNEPPVRPLVDSEYLDLQLLSVGFAADSGVYVCSILAVIKDPSYWEEYGRYMELNHESKRSSLHLVSTRDARRIDNLLRSPVWVDESLVTFSLALQRLQEIAPQRVNLPEFKVGLAAVGAPKRAQAR